MRLYRLYIFLIIIFATLTKGLDIYGPQPKIFTQNGHLIFRAAEHKNISIETTGRGKIIFNGLDVSNTAQLVVSAKAVLNKYTQNFQQSFLQVDRFRYSLLGPNGLLARLRNIEAKANNLTMTKNPLNNPKVKKLTEQLKNTQNNLKIILSLLIKDDCRSNPCKNGGVCQDLFHDFLCHCPDQWEGKTCESDVNECTRFLGTDLGCQNGATCVNQQGSYQCLCAQGWFGLHCTKKTEVCTGASAEFCGHGACVPQNTAKGYVCICDQGWTNDETTKACTKDVDECKSQRPPCSLNPLVKCQNIPGSFRCESCPPGFTGDGFYCNDINECELFNGGCSMNPLVECKNSWGSKNCGPCPPGYEGDGVTCSYRGICHINNGGCHPLATCKDYPKISSTYVDCVCPNGYYGNGRGLTGCVLSSATPCEPNPCINGLCIANVSLPGGYACQCQRGFSGDHCEISSNPCATNPCKNGGTCIKVGFTFSCRCRPQFTGLTCSTERQWCSGKIEQENGTLKYPLTGTFARTSVHSCAWIIETTPHKIINLNFTNFNLKDTKECNVDWVQIHDGKNTNARNLGRFCGKNLPNGGKFVSTSNDLYIWFRTNGIGPYSFTATWNSTIPTSHFQISVKSHGTLQSPGAPGNYPNKRDVFWNLQAPLGKRLLFHFYSLSIGNDVNCTGDYLKFYSTGNVLDKPFAVFCNSTEPTPLYSPGSNVNVYFHSNEKDTYPGFQISYSVVEGIPGCGGVFTSDSGEIRSPSIHGKYPSNLECEYKIILPDQLRVRITFTTFELEYSDGCKYDFVAIYDGPSTSSPLIGRYCGNDMPAAYTVGENQVTILFKSDWASSGKGFALEYETICGGIYTKPQGVIQSDGYPTRYLPDIICVYEIVQPVGYIIELNIIDLKIEYTAECEFDYLEIRDGDNENGTLLGKFCGHKNNYKVISSYNSMWIKFISDESVGDRGFKANYTTKNLGCGGILRDKMGTIQSPSDEAGHYKSLSKCMWVLFAPPNYVIQLSWVTFHLEGRMNCDFDYLLIYDNNTITGQGNLIGRYCGSKIPPVLLSVNNVVSIIFVSDQSVNFGGFSGSYTFIDGSKLCGGNYYTSSGVLRSPGFPKILMNSLDCTWTISVPTRNQIMLNTTTFDLGRFSNCESNFLEIRNGHYATSPLMGKFCGTTIPKLITSHTNQIYIHFKVQKNAKFESFWESAATGCGGLLSSPSGSIISPEYPETYSRLTNCYWKIVVSAGSKIQVGFTDIDLESHTYCMTDYIELFDGDGINSPLIGRYCNPSYPGTIESTQNHMYVHFRSDVSLQGRGFQMQYFTMCNNVVSGFYGVIESPNYPNPYPVVQKCVWNIKVSMGNKINITFSHFNLNKILHLPNTECKTNYLEIKYTDPKSFEENAPVTYGKYCAKKEPPRSIALNSNEAQIEFVTDTALFGTGFRLEWRLNGCGGKMYGQGIISTPNYPNFYPHSTECVWVLETEIGYHIEIKFLEIDVERSSVCDSDSIKVYNGIDKSYPLLSTLCHQDNAVKLRSMGHTMSVYFTSDYSYEGKGFKAIFSTVKSACGGEIKAQSGSIFTPNYPKNYANKNETCEWILTVDDNHIVELDFKDVSLLNAKAFCKRNYIKIFDGPSPAYPVLDTICGTANPNRTIRSTRNHMFVQFISYPFLSSKGFAADFRKGCGAIINATSTGNIQMHPEFIPDVYEKCTWTIRAPESGDHVSLTINFIDSPKNEILKSLQTENCNNTLGVKVYDGDSINSTLLGKYCGTRVPPTLTSSGKTLHVECDKDIQFFATYSAFDSNCGGTLKSLNGFFSTPGYPKSYPFETECEWTLHVAPGNQIDLNFQYFDLIESENCDTDFLEIRTHNSSGPLLGTFCGQNKPLNITHVGSLWIYFKSSKFEGDSSLISKKGFLAEYSHSFHNLLTGVSGQIASPLYPALFRSTGTFSWRVTVTFGKRISFTIKELKIETFTTSTCSGYSLQIYDGIDAMAPLLKTLCGYISLDSVKTSSNEAFISIQIISGRIGARFLIDWLEVENFNDNTKKNNTIEGCGSNGVIDINDLRNYTIKSPGYPKGYANDLNCEWIFSTISMNHLVLRFKSLDIHGFYGSYSGFCYNDFVELFYGKDGSQQWKSAEKLCLKNQTQLNYHSSSLLKVRFSSNYRENGTGFEAVIKEGCGGNMNEPEGYIIYDDKNPRSTYCQWNITVGTGKRIQIKFLTSNISPKTDKGCTNFVLLRNGADKDSPLLGPGKFCGSNIPNILNTTGNHLTVIYSGSFLIKGFKLHYRELSYDCGGQFELSQYENSMEITSPNYPNIPPVHTDCIWIIRSPPGTSLQIDFKERFDITRSYNCIDEGVEIRDGATEFSPSLGRFCRTKPSSVASKGNMMYIKFFTNVELPKNGFKATVQLAKCGGIYSGLEGTIKWSSLNHGTNLNNNNCSWSIEVPEEFTIKIKFETLRFHYNARECTSEKEKIMIYRVPPLKYLKPVLQKTVCNASSKNEVIQINSNEAMVKFLHFQQVILAPASYFTISYKAVKANCTHYMTSSSGVIVSPMPKKYSTTCIWHIKAPEGRRILLRFIMLNLDPSYDLSEQGIALVENINYKVPVTYISKSTDPRIYKTSGNELHIYSWLPSNKNGFYAVYGSHEKSVCTSSIDKNSGTLTKPLDTSIFSCYYKRLKTNQNQTIKFSIDFKTNVQQKNSVNCANSKNGILIFTMLQRKHLLDEVCVNTTGAVFRLPYSRLDLQTWGKSENVNYTVTYNTYDCGGIIETESGTISSPNLINPKINELDCSWLIKLPNQERINVTFVTFDLEGNCNNSFLQIFNGFATASPRIGKYCNNNKPKIIQSERNVLLIDYHYEKGHGTGFNLTFEPIIMGCGGTFHTERKIIESPGYPQYYKNNAECTWEVMAPEGFHIGFYFVSRFHLEAKDNCANDFIEVFDWINNEYKSIKKLCGREFPSPVNSTSNRMKIMFRSNDKINAQGFKASWNFNCGGKFSATQQPQYIVSPGYPLNYRNRLICEYEITTDENKFITVDFLDFELEPGMPLCSSDNLTIKGNMGYVVDGGPSKIFCGKTVPPVSHYKKDVTITFMSDFWLSARGFKFSFRGDSCGGAVTTPQIIETKKVLLQNDMYSRGTCLWNITAPANKIVVFRFEKFISPLNYYCSYDNVKIYNGLNTNSENEIVNLCGNLTNQLPTIMSLNNTATLFSYSNSLGSDVKFKVEVFFSAGPKQGCGGTFNVTQNKITTISSTPNEAQDCFYKIIAPLDYQLKLIITDLTLPDCSQKNKCSCGLLEIRDGGTPVSNPITKLCSSQSNEITYMTSKNFAFIRTFLTQSGSFKIKIKAVMSICGPTLLNVTKNAQYLTTPNYPNRYPENIKCTWVFTHNISYEIFKLRFIDFDLTNTGSLELAKTCDYDSIEIEEGDSKELEETTIFAGRGAENNYASKSPGVQTFCGSNEKPFDIYSSKNFLRVIFTSKNGLNRGRGFKLLYQSTGCNQNYTQDNGRIAFNSNTPENCTVLITVSKNKKISLYFKELYGTYERDDNCSDTALIVTDVVYNKTLLRACDYQVPNPVFSLSNRIELKLLEKNTGITFDAIYTSDEKGQGCGGSFYDAFGQFTSPNYPNAFRNNTLCVWNIKAARTSMLKITFTSFDIQASCDINYIDIITYELGQAQGNVHHFCKEDNIASLISVGKITVKYKASVYNGGLGWEVKFETVDDNTSTLPGDGRGIVME